jgi:hypothetical protein
LSRSRSLCAAISSCGVRPRMRAFILSILRTVALGRSCSIRVRCFEGRPNTPCWTAQWRQYCARIVQWPAAPFRRLSSRNSAQVREPAISATLNFVSIVFRPAQGWTDGQANFTTLPHFSSSCACRFQTDCELEVEAIGYIPN